MGAKGEWGAAPLPNFVRVGDFVAAKPLCGFGGAAPPQTCLNLQKKFLNQEELPELSDIWQGINLIAVDKNFKMQMRSR